MFVKRVAVRNWRSIGEDPGVTLDLGRINLLTGINDSGKTSILVALYAILKSTWGVSSDPFLKDFLMLEGSMHENEDGRISKELSVEVFASLSEPLEREVRKFLMQQFKDYSEELSNRIVELTIQNLLNRFYTTNFKIGMNDGPVQFFTDEAIHVVHKTLNEEGLQEVAISEISKKIKFLNHTLFLRENSSERLDCFYIPPDRYYNINHQSDLDAISQRKGNRLELNYVVSDLVYFVQTIRTEQYRRRGAYDAFLDYVNIMFPEITSIETTVPDGIDKQDVFIHWDINGRNKMQPLSRSGSGVVSAVYLSARLVCSTNSSQIGFIDEPETGLHPKLQVRFVKLLRALSDDWGIQWIISSHSPFFMQNLKGEDKLFLLSNNGVNTTAREIAPTDKSLVFQSLGVYLPDSIISKGVVFVEGETERTILPILLDKCGIDIDKEGIVIIPLGGDNLFCIPPLELSKIHPKILVLLDSDLAKSEEEGGHVKQRKINYEEECKRANIQVFMSREYRSVENMYPVSTLSNVLNIDPSSLIHTRYCKVDKIPDSKKIDIGRRVAEEMTPEEARIFPLVSSILNWLDS